MKNRGSEKIVKIAKVTHTHPVSSRTELHHQHAENLLDIHLSLQHGHNRYGQPNDWFLKQPRYFNAPLKWCSRRKHNREACSTYALSTLTTNIWVPMSPNESIKLEMHIHSHPAFLHFRIWPSNQSFPISNNFASQVTPANAWRHFCLSQIVGEDATNIS